MERYLVFGGMSYYPAGGWDDFVSDHDTLEAALHAARKRNVALGVSQWWVHVLDTALRPPTIVFRNGK